MKMACYALLAIPSSLIATATCLAEQKDAANCKYHPLLTRLPDCWIEAAHLKAYGSGPYSPVASNDSEEGRAKDRRVEFVKQ